MSESLNKNQPTTYPQIHLSANDGKTIEEATQIVFHKMSDGQLFVEWYFDDEHAAFYKSQQMQTTFDATALAKLREFFANETTY